MVKTNDKWADEAKVVYAHKKKAEKHGWVVLGSSQGIIPEDTKVLFSNASEEWEEDMVSPDAELGIGKVRMEKDVLLQKLKENLEKHREEYVTALKGWKIEVIEQMEKNLADAKEGKEFETEIAVEEPMDHSKEYEHVISMLEVSLDKNIVLSSQEFAQFYNDQWRWKGHHAHLLNAYSMKL